LVGVSGSILDDAFAHHVWATMRLIDTCLALNPEQLGTTVPGTYGSILETMRHLVEAEPSYLVPLTGDRSLLINVESMSLRELRAAAESYGSAWSGFLAQDLDPDAIVHEVDDDDAYERDATVGVRLAQALHHGTDHRSQICTALTALGVEPPGIDAWNYGLQAGRVVEFPPAS
jgi:uncharacterized damage-inducible protein DinB